MNDLQQITERLAASSVSTQAAPRASKSAAVIKLLSRARGASIAELQEATGWQPHSVRAFLSGLRKQERLILKEERKTGETAYRLAKNKAAISTTEPQ